MKKIMIFYGSYGGGHLSAARYIREYIENNYTDIEIQMVDCMEYISKTINKVTTKAYSEFAKKAPWAWGYIYKKAEKGAKATILAAQVADTLINIEGIRVGVAINEYKDGSLGVSARSDGSVNVQIIMEELGGGGHQTVAGVQLDNMRAADIEPQIIALAKKQLEQLEEKDNNESDSVTRC